MVRERGNKTTNINVKKTAAYTNVHGDIVNNTSKIAKIKKVTSLDNILTFGDVLLINITCFIFAVFDVSTLTFVLTAVFHT